jgi:hypothetical protein
MSVPPGSPNLPGGHRTGKNRSTIKLRRERQADLKHDAGSEKQERPPIERPFEMDLSSTGES